MLRRTIKKSSSLLAILLILISHAPLHAFAAANLVVTESDIRFSKEEPLVGDSIRIYAKVANRGSDDQRGIVKFFDGKTKQIGSDQPFSILKGNTADVFTDFGNLPYGERTITVKVLPFGSRGEVFSTATSLFVDRDSDKDGTPDRRDDDDDNDGVQDTNDAFPLDPGESVDTDKDAVGDNKDNDDDNDGVKDDDEQAKGTDSKKFDTDGDGVNDQSDVFPLDEKESQDTDADGIGDNQEVDDDNDGVEDSRDAFPRDKNESVDTDGDRIGDNSDLDDDNDDLPDGREKDLMTDPKNPDTDGDGVVDGKDAFPLDPKESKDTDHDGLGDNQDSNPDNKGPVLKYQIPENISLWFPYYFDAQETSDPDGKIAKISWKLDGRIIEGEDFVDFFLIPGYHTLVLQATDDAGEMREKTITFWVSPVLYIFFGLIGGLVWLIRKVIKKMKKGPFRKKKLRD